MTNHFFPQAALLACSLALAAPAFAHGDTKRAEDAPISTEETAFGRQGDPKKIVRTIAIDMRDTMRFNPSSIRVRQGETIRFVVKNNGRAMHEMVLGTMAELRRHGELMKQHPGMEHDEPYMAHVDPGKTQRIVWQFTRPGTFHYACLVARHFEAGMIGKIEVVPAGAARP